MKNYQKLLLSGMILGIVGGIGTVPLGSLDNPYPLKILAVGVLCFGVFLISTVWEVL